MVSERPCTWLVSSPWAPCGPPLVRRPSRTQGCRPRRGPAASRMLFGIVVCPRADILATFTFLYPERPDLGDSGAPAGRRLYAYVQTTGDAPILSGDRDLMLRAVLERHPQGAHVPPRRRPSRGRRSSRAAASTRSSSRVPQDLRRRATASGRCSARCARPRSPPAPAAGPASGPGARRAQPAPDTRPACRGRSTPRDRLRRGRGRASRRVISSTSASVSRPRISTCRSTETSQSWTRSRRCR